MYLRRKSCHGKVIMSDTKIQSWRLGEASFVKQMQNNFWISSVSYRRNRFTKHIPTSNIASAKGRRPLEHDYPSNDMYITLFHFPLSKHSNYLEGNIWCLEEGSAPSMVTQPLRGSLWLCEDFPVFLLHLLNHLSDKGRWQWQPTVMLNVRETAKLAAGP